MKKLTAPAWLTPEGKKIFKEIVGFDANETLFEKADQMLIALLADNMQEYIRCSQELHHGTMMTIETGNGYPKEVEKPEVMQKERAVKSVLNIIGKLGISPESRNKMRIELSKSDASGSALEGLMNRLGESTQSIGRGRGRPRKSE